VKLQIRDRPRNHEQLKRKKTSQESPARCAAATAEVNMPRPLLRKVALGIALGAVVVILVAAALTSRHTYSLAEFQTMDNELGTNPARGVPIASKCMIGVYCPPAGWASIWQSLVSKMQKEMSTDTMEIANLKNQVSIDKANEAFLLKKYQVRSESPSAVLEIARTCRASA